MTFVLSAFVRMLKLMSVILIVSFLTFMLTKLLPGSPVNLILGSEAGNPEARAALEDRLGLNEPIWRQYLELPLRGVLRAATSATRTSRRSRPPPTSASGCRPRSS